MTRPRVVGAWVLALCLAWPVVSQACPGCISISERNRLAFFNTTIFMSLMPLGMIGGGLWWLRRRGRGFLAEEFEDRDAAGMDTGAEEHR